MTSIRLIATAAFCASTLTAPAFAGEVNGSDSNPKHYFAQGASICEFSGLNDNPTSTNPANPGGKTQSYGQEVRLGYLDPTVSSVFFPGVLCNPNNLNLHDGGSGL